MKILLGIPNDVCAFDDQLGELIQSTIFSVSNLIPGISDEFQEISPKEIKYEDFLPSLIMMPAVEKYIYYCVKLDFDPPSNTSVLQSLNEYIKKMEYMLVCRFDTGGENSK